MEAYYNEDRITRLFEMGGFFNGIVFEKGKFKGYGCCNHCYYAEIMGEREEHPEGIGDVVTGCNIQCNHPHDQTLPIGLALWGGTLSCDEPCPRWIPNICELCRIMFDSRQCKDCVWNEEERVKKTL